MGKVGNRYFNLLYLLGCLVLLALFLIPLIASWENLFFDDIAFSYYPQQVFLSRCFDEGVMPWWDPNTCAGAKPFYSQLSQASLYPVQWIFFKLAAGTVPSVKYFWLVKAPLALHYLIGLILAFSFGRWGLRLNRVGASVLGLTYVLSPTMIQLAPDPATVAIQSWLPLFCLCLTIFARGGKRGWLVLGALAFALASPGGDVPFVFHMVLIGGLFGTAWSIAALLRRDKKAAGRMIFGLIFIFGAGFLLSGIYWANMIDGLRLAVEGSTDTVEELAGRYQSLHPIYLATLLIPDFFGGITSFHVWGAAYSIHYSLNDVSLLGGLAGVFLVLLGFRSCLRDRPPEGEGADLFPPRTLYWIFFSLFILSIFIVLGAYTPVYYLLRFLIPVLRMPYPVRFRSIECFALAGLLGTSASLLWSDPPAVKRRLVLLYLAGAAGLGLIALFWPVQAFNRHFFPGWRHLTTLGDWGWFLKVPLAYLVAVGLVLLIGAGLSGKRFLWLLLVLVVAESFFFAYQGLYDSRVLNRRIQDISGVRSSGPTNHPVYQALDRWKTESSAAKHLYRRAYYRSSFDNLAWVDDSLSVLGFDTKPMDPRFTEVIKELAPGVPYELWPKNWEAGFWRNMSVKDLVHWEPIGDPGVKKQGRLGALYTYELTHVLPRIYFQDRWAVADDEKQLAALRDYDLRAIGYCELEMWSGRPYREEVLEADPLDEEEWIDHFMSLQKKNELLAIDVSSPNRLEMDIKVNRPSVLVVTDLWHPDWRATVDGKGEKIWRVNYLQRGVWVGPGRHRIVMEFLPASLKRGLALTALGLIALWGLLFFPRNRQIVQN